MVHVMYRKPDKSEVEEQLDPCPNCDYLLPQTVLDCPQCKSTLPYCIITVSLRIARVHYHNYKHMPKQAVWIYTMQAV